MKDINKTKIWPKNSQKLLCFDVIKLRQNKNPLFLRTFWEYLCYIQIISVAIRSHPIVFLLNIIKEYINYLFYSEMKYTFLVNKWKTQRLLDFQISFTLVLDFFQNIKQKLNFVETFGKKLFSIGFDIRFVRKWHLGRTVGSNE